MGSKDGMKLCYFKLISQVSIGLFAFSKINLGFERTPDKAKTTETINVWWLPV